MPDDGLGKKHKKPKTAHAIQIIFIKKRENGKKFCIIVLATARQISANRNYRRQNEQLLSGRLKTLTNTLAHPAWPALTGKWSAPFRASAI